MDETGADYTEWSKPERKTPIQYTNTYIWNLEWWPCMQDHKRDTDVKNRFLDPVGEGKGGMIWENVIETCILSSVQFSSVTQSCPTLCNPMNCSMPGLPISYVKWITSPGSMHETGCSGLEHWDDPEGWEGEGSGSGVQDGEHMYTHGGCMSLYGKTTTKM